MMPDYKTEKGGSPYENYRKTEVLGKEVCVFIFVDNIERTNYVPIGMQPKLNVCSVHS